MTFGFGASVIEPGSAWSTTRLRRLRDRISQLCGLHSTSPIVAVRKVPAGFVTRDGTQDTGANATRSSHSGQVITTSIIIVSIGMDSKVADSNYLFSQQS